MTDTPAALVHAWSTVKTPLTPGVVMPEMTVPSGIPEPEMMSPMLAVVMEEPSVMVKVVVPVIVAVRVARV